MDSILTLNGITKIYPGVVALDRVSIDFRPGEIHALLGENGAGKSTLIKVISGAIEPEEGTISLGGETFRRMTPKLAKAHGVEVIYQEFNLVESLSIAENIFLGEKDGKLFDRRTVADKARRLLDSLGLDMDPDESVETLSPAKKQLVEICKSISRNVRILIMDEPTAPLSAAEVEIMYGIVDRLKAQGVTIIYISHRMEEIFRLADRVTVLRDGCYVDTLPIAKTHRQALVSLMVGREFKESYPRRVKAAGAPLLELRHVTGNGDTDISFVVREGEIYGLAGLVGAGRTELAGVIFGAAPMESGEVLVGGKPVALRTPKSGIDAGMGLIPEDRKLLGCLQESDIRFNISMASIRKLCKAGVIDNARENALAEGYRRKLQIKTPSLRQLVKNLSGGNQQKVVLAKSLAAEPRVLIFDEPTRGIDVGAKHEIYVLMNGLAEQGCAILMISSDLEELLGMSDRIAVLHEGRLAGELTREEFDPKLVIGLASGMTKEELACQD